MYLRYIILLITTLLIAIFVFALALRNYLRSKSKIERNIIFLESLLTGLIIYRILEASFYFSLEIGSMLFWTCNGLLGITIIFTVYTIFQFLQQTGTVLSKKNFILLYISVVCAISFIMNLFFYEFRIIEGHFIFGMSFELLIPITILLFIGTIIVLFVTFKESMELYEHSMKRKMQICFLLHLANVFTISLFSAIFSMELLIFLVITILIAHIGLVLMNYFEPQIITKFWSYFVVQSIYIIKNDGRTMFNYDFTKKANEDDNYTEMFLIGGFIYAITHGIEHITKVKTSIKLIDVQRIKIAFYFGKYSFSILFTREINNQIYKKLKGFMTEFERDFAPIIADWDGRIESFFEAGQIKNEFGFQRTLNLHEILDRYFKTR